MSDGFACEDDSIKISVGSIRRKTTVSMELAALYSVLPMDIMKIEFICRRHMKLFDTSLLPGEAEFFGYRRTAGSVFL